MKNIKIIKEYYKAFENGDVATMLSFYDDDIKFEDPAIGKIKGDEAKYWWQFLCENSVDLSIDIKEIKIDEDKGIAIWTNHYTVEETGNRVSLDIVSKFYFEDGLIIKHIDEYDIKSFVKQAFGKAAGIVGGSFLVKKTVRLQSKKLLKQYMIENALLG